MHAAIFARAGDAILTDLLPVSVIVPRSSIIARNRLVFNRLHCQREKVLQHVFHVNFIKAVSTRRNFRTER